MIQPAQGTLLIADPFLKDPYFMRSVVLLCRHNAEEGSFGFTLHSMVDFTLDELLKDLESYPLPVYNGGPVQLDTIHYLHQYPNLFEDAVMVAEDIYWGGDFDLLKSFLAEGKIDFEKIKFFLGYSGWSAGQLDEEMKEGSWLVAHANKKLIFDTHHEDIWRQSLMELGGKYKSLVHYPTDPQLN